MKSVSVSKSMAELLEDLFRPGEVSKQPVKDRILARLQRKSNNLTDEQKYDVSERLGGETIREYAKELKSCTEEAFVRRCREDKDFLLWFDNLKGKKRGHYYSEKEDTLLETTRGYGDTEKPQDYLDSFVAYVNENKDRIEAIRIACTRPSDMTRAQLRELKLELDKENFTESSLNEAASAVSNERIVADIIAFVRRAVLKTPLVNHDDRVKMAFSKLISAHHFNKMQLDLLEKIKVYMLHESILNTETFEAPAFKMDGGFARFNKKFGGQLAEIIREKALHALDEEIPHGIAVTIEKMRERKGQHIVDIEATIICERDSHKGIIIGKQGSMLKKIGSNARFEIEKMLEERLNLKIWVKVKKDWRDSDTLMKNFGYNKKEI